MSTTHRSFASDHLAAPNVSSHRGVIRMMSCPNTPKVRSRPPDPIAEVTSAGDKHKLIARASHFASINAGDECLTRTRQRATTE